MIRYYCDKCRKRINSNESANVFRMWDLTRVDTLSTYRLEAIAFDDDYIICDECFEKLFNED